MAIKCMEQIFSGPHPHCALCVHVHVACVRVCVRDKHGNGHRHGHRFGDMAIWPMALATDMATNMVMATHMGTATAIATI